MANILKKVLHNTSSKSPQDLVSRTSAAAEKLTETASERQQEELSKYLTYMKAAMLGMGRQSPQMIMLSRRPAKCLVKVSHMLQAAIFGDMEVEPSKDHAVLLCKDTRKAAMFGDGEAEPSKDHAVLLCWEACKMGLPLVLAHKLTLLDFETRKDAAQVCGCIFRMESNADGPGVRFVHEHPEILDILFQGYNNPNIALNCGSMLRDCVRDASLARMVLEGPLFAQYFEKVQATNFEVASDAFQTFKDLLTRHKPLVGQYLNSHYDEFFQQYEKLLTSDNYVTRRQSLKLLGELLLDRANVKVMMRYVSDSKNLQMMMMLLKDNSRSIQFEAFHVFKVFVANPNKTEKIAELLQHNKDKLLRYLGDFHTDKEDEQFKEEKAVIIKEISMLEPMEQDEQF